MVVPLEQLLQATGQDFTKTLLSEHSDRSTPHLFQTALVDSPPEFGPRIRRELCSARASVKDSKSSSQPASADLKYRAGWNMQRSTCCMHAGLEMYFYQDMGAPPGAIKAFSVKGTEIKFSELDMLCRANKKAVRTLSFCRLGLQSQMRCLSE